MAQAGLGSPARLRRERLLDRIDAAPQVAVLQAESGAGKTVLAADWVHREAGRLIVAWVTLDDDSGSHRAFWARVLSAFTRVLPERFGEPFERSAIAIDPFGQAPSLLAETLMTLDAPVVLVLDDLHLVPDDVQDEIVSVAMRAPLLKLLVTSRARTRFEQPLVAAALDTTVIDSRDLSFTDAEVSALAADLSYEPDAADLEMLQRLTRGHALATRLGLSVIESLSRQGSHRPSRHEVMRGIDDAVRDLVPAFEDEAERDLAYAVALCPEVDEPLADRLAEQQGLERPGWEAVLRLEERGLGRVADQGGRPVLVLHALVASALRQRALAVMPQQRIEEVRLTAIEYLRESGDPIAVIELMLEAGYDSAVMPHFLRHFSELSMQRTQEAIAIFSALPKKRLERDGTLPAMLVAFLIERNSRPTAQMQALMRIALPALAKQRVGASPQQLALYAAAEFAALRSLGRYEEASDQGEEMLAAIDALGPESEGADWNAAILQVVITHLLSGRLERAIAVAERLEEDQHPRRRRHLHSLLAFAHTRAGDVASATRALRALGAVERPGWNGSMYAVGWHLASALGRLAHGDPASALDVLQPLDAALPRLEMWPAVLWTRGTVRLLSGSVEVGREELTAALREHSNRPISEAWREQLLTLLAELTAASGNTSEALTILPEEGEQSTTAIARARIHLLMQHPQRALAELRRTEELFLDHSQALLLRAAAHARLGDIETAGQFARGAGDALVAIGNTTTLALVPREDLDRLRALAPDYDWEGPYAPLYPEPEPAEPLTKREQLVLSRLVGQGSLDDVANELHVSPNTVKSQTRSIYRKLGVSNRGDAVAKALRLGLGGEH